MKKCFAILFLVLTLTICTFAAERPRWVSLPINVYIPEYGDMSRAHASSFYVLAAAVKISSTF